MNDQELDDVLAGFRDDVPEMSEGAFLLGKLRLEEATTPRPEPLPELSPLPVRREIVDLQRRRSPPRHLTPWIMAAASVAVLAVGATLVLNPSAPATPPPPPEISMAQAPPVTPTTVKPRAVYPPAPVRPPAETDSAGSGVPLPPATHVYNAAGDLADHVSDPPQAPGQYLYMAKQERGKSFQVAPGATLGGGTPTGEWPGYWNEWVPLDRSAAWQVSLDVHTGIPNEHIPGNPPVPSMISGLSEQEGTFRAAGGDYQVARNTGWQMPTEAFIASLPRDPKALYQRLSKDSEFGYDPQATALQLAGELLSRPVPAELRRALFRALAYHPWLTINENAKTKDGRSAVSLRVDEGFVRTTMEILIDPANGRLIGTRTTWQDPDEPKKIGVVAEESIVHWSVVNQIGATS